MEHIEEAKTTIPADARFWHHARTPQNLGVCDKASASATGVGSCGDSMRVDLCIDGDFLAEVRCNPKGCVYTQACASAMSTLAQGCTLDAALQLQPGDVVRELEGLPDDHLHCARLAINTLGEAIDDYVRRQFREGRSNAGVSTAMTGDEHADL